MPASLVAAARGLKAAPALAAAAFMAGTLSAALAATPASLAQGAPPAAAADFAKEPPMAEEEIPLALDLLTVSRTDGATDEDFQAIRESFGLTEGRAAFIMARAASAILILDDPANRARAERVFGTPHALPTPEELGMVSSYLKDPG
jgi:hypothetical protein